MILVIDNYDSFTYNLVQYLGELGQALVVRRNDRVALDEIEAMRPAGILISPGPCTPNEAGVCLDLVRRLSSRIPIFGVCLGHQAIGQAFGGEVVRNFRVLHGKVSQIHHHGSGVFSGLPNPFPATRYHSLVIKRETMPQCLEVTAETEEGEVMGVRHREFPVEGVQFHPESVMTAAGKDLMRNWVGQTAAAAATRARADAAS